MFEYIKGRLEDTTRDTAVIDAGGVGYEVIVPSSTLNALPHLGETAKLFIHFHVREDTQKLYGFFTKSEREVFRQLMSVSKIGPKVAMNVLSGLPVKDIIYSVQMQDTARLGSISGIGPKTAQRLVMELKGKLHVSEYDLATPVHDTGGRHMSPSSIIRNDAFAAMIALGYNESQVVHALSRVEETLDGETPVEEWIKKALQVI